MKLISRLFDTKNMQNERASDNEETSNDGKNKKGKFQRAKDFLWGIDEKKFNKFWEIILVSSFLAIPLFYLYLHLVEKMDAIISPKGNQEVFWNNLALTGAFWYIGIIALMGYVATLTAKIGWKKLVSFAVFCLSIITFTIRYHYVWFYILTVVQMYWIAYCLYLAIGMLSKYIKKSIEKSWEWIIKDSTKDENIKNKLSFLNKIILGVIGIVAAIVALIIKFSSLLGLK